MVAFTLVNLLALGASVHAVAFDGPRPTPAQDPLYLVNGWSPKPTNRAESLPELFRRQASPGLCGYISGDPQYSISCSTGSCLYNTRINWFGCCTGTVVDSCNVATRCVPSSSVSSCLSDSACASDSFLTACTGSSAPACGTLFSIVSQKSISHLVCIASSTAAQIFASTTGGSGTASTAALSSVGGSSLRATVSSPIRASSVVSDIVVGSSDRGLTPTSQTPNVVVVTRTAGAAMQTAKAMIGGVVGVVAALL